MDNYGCTTGVGFDATMADELPVTDQEVNDVAGNTEHLPRLLSTDELAEHLGVTQRHVRRLVAERRVPFLKWRRFVRFDPTEIAMWLDSARRPEVTGLSGPRHDRSA